MRSYPWLIASFIERKLVLEHSRNQVGSATLTQLKRTAQFIAIDHATGAITGNLTS